ncbi:MAG: eCIS core domain-containing protein [Methylobacter sp.]
MSKLTFQQRGNQNTRIPVSQRRTAGGKAQEDNRAAFAAKQLKQDQTAQLTKEEDELLKGKSGTKQLAKKDEEEIGQAKFSDRGPPMQREQQPTKPNNTGLPDQLKSGIESLSGLSMDNVKVHYNSAKPQQLNALAYAQGTDIHVGPGQEKHLPHEAWHVVQQTQGRVRPTMQMKEGVPVNDDKELEREADVMGGKAIQMVSDGNRGVSPIISWGNGSAQMKQLRALQGVADGRVGKSMGDGGGQKAISDPGLYRPTTIAQRQIRGVANNSPQAVQQRAVQRMTQGQVVQRGQGQSSEKKEETILKLESYLKSSGIDHSGEKDASATKTAKILDGWRKEKKIAQFWLTNQSNIIEFQKSKYKAMGGACYVIMQSFLRHALTDGSQTDVLDQFNAGNLSESLEMEELLTGQLTRCKEIRMELDENGLAIEAEMEKEKEAQNTELIMKKLQENELLLNMRGEIMKEINSKLIKEKDEKDMKGFDAGATIGEIKSLAEGAYEIRLLRNDHTGHALGIVKSKDFESNDWYDFMDPSSMSFSGKESSLEKVERILSTFYASRYTNIKIIQYEKFA